MLVVLSSCSISAASISMFAVLNARWRKSPSPMPLLRAMSQRSRSSEIEGRTYNACADNYNNTFS